MTSDLKWIDVHHHSYYPEIVKALRERGVTSLAPGVPVPDWDVAKSIRAMDINGIAVAITSVLLPNEVYYGSGFQARDLLRRTNELSARLIQEHPERFGAFGMLPLPDLDGALAEIEYVLDILKLDGFVLSASLANGCCLGDPALDAVFDELNRRQAVVFIHPNPSYRCVCVGGDEAKLAVPPPVVDFVFDTTRAIVNLLYSGTLHRCPDIKFIVAHAGGAVPYLVWRIGLGPAWLFPAQQEFQAKVPQGIETYLRRLYYDTAQSASPHALRSLQEVAEPSRILFGSDYPFMTEAILQASIENLQRYDGFDSPMLARVARENTLEILPRLRAESSQVAKGLDLGGG